MMRYCVLSILIILPLLLVGCGGSEGAATGDAVGYIYGDAGQAAADAADSLLYLLSGRTSDPLVKVVAGATVILVEAERTTRTSWDGSYAFFDVEPGEYTLRASHPSYTACQWQIRVRAAHTTFGENRLRRNVRVPQHRESDWRWNDDDDDDDDDDDSSGGGGGSVPQPPPTDDSTDDGGGISIFRVTE